ncbi:hypothetical protein N784_13875 [Pontibacillus litoralis JSM 072002]|uniref:Uncharacterized protein n=1 Tax=Pontibacillus litoralis JSM 072002 TaxID=1385512 RepID=A0A0A5G3V2_9BACI|nr:hypothetical protein N784_13875 [Pontibacillus litoralis JSM 072002]
MVGSDAPKYKRSVKKAVKYKRKGCGCGKKKKK